MSRDRLVFERMVDAHYSVHETERTINSPPMVNWGGVRVKLWVTVF